MSDEKTQSIRLLGQPKLSEHLDFVHDLVVDGDKMNRAELVDDWRRANDYYFKLEEQEADLANEIDVFNLDPALHQLMEDTMADPRYQYTFDKFPTSFAMIELDKLVISQLHVNHNFSEQLQSKLDPKPDPETLFKFCLPPLAPEHTVRIRKTGSKRYQFSSESSDFRTHNAVVLKPDQVLAYDTFGPISGMVGLGVGFGSNFLTAIRAEDRVLLHNGYHRAHALRSVGITHAPCILQSVTRLDELEIAAKSDVTDDPNYYFGSPRPPLLKDFFDPYIRKEFEVYRTVKKVDVTIDIREYYERL